jgi:hypothetical protein
VARVRIVAIASLLVAGTPLLAGCDEPEPPVAPSVSTTDAAQPTGDAGQPAGEEATTVPLGGFPAGNPLEPGRYQANPGFDVPFEIELGDGWRSIRDESFGVISFVSGRRNSIGHATQWLSLFPAPPDVGTEELLDLILAQPDLVTGNPEAVSVGGVSGTRIEARARLDPAQGGDPEVEPGVVPIDVANRLITGGFWFTESAKARVAFIILGLGDRSLLLYLEAPADRFDAFVVRAEEALAGLTFVG